MRAPGAALALAFALAAPASASPELDYMLHCQGCHLADGSGSPGAVPSLHGVGRFLHTSRGREYLIRVPGSAQSPLGDAALAALLDWIVARFDPETAAAGFHGFDAAEIARWRRPPLTEVDALRAELLAELSSSGASAEGACSEAQPSEVQRSDPACLLTASDANGSPAARDRAGSGSQSPAPARPRSD